MTLEELRSRTSPLQREILTSVWDYYAEKRDWKPSRLLHHEFRRQGKAAVREELRTLGGTVVYESGFGENQAYLLTFLGILLSNRGVEAVGLCLRYLTYARDRFEARPEDARIESLEVETALGLTPKQSRELSELIQVSGFLWSGSGQRGDQQWSYGLPRDIDDLTPDLHIYIQAEAVAHYEPNMPISESARITYQLPPAATAPDQFAKSIEVAETLSSLHPEIHKRCRVLFEQGHYGEAVEKGFKVVRDRLRSLTGYERGAEAFGSGKLHIAGAIASHVDKDFNEGVKFLTMAIDRFRNEKSHSADAATDDPVRAYEYLCLSSLAMRLLDQAQM